SPFRNEEPAVPRQSTRPRKRRGPRPGRWPPAVCPRWEPRRRRAVGPVPAGSGRRLGLGTEYFEDVLEGQRLEIQPVGGVVVGGYRFWVAVDHHCFKTRL